MDTMRSRQEFQVDQTTHLGRRKCPPPPFLPTLGDVSQDAENFRGAFARAGLPATKNGGFFRSRGPRKPSAGAHQVGLTTFIIFIIFIILRYCSGQSPCFSCVVVCWREFDSLCAFVFLSCTEECIPNKNRHFFYPLLGVACAPAFVNV